MIEIIWAMVSGGFSGRIGAESLFNNLDGRLIFRKISKTGSCDNNCVDDTFFTRKAKTRHIMIEG